MNTFVFMAWHVMYHINNFYTPINAKAYSRYLPRLISEALNIFFFYHCVKYFR